MVEPTKDPSAAAVLRKGERKRERKKKEGKKAESNLLLIYLALSRSPRYFRPDDDTALECFGTGSSIEVRLPFT